MEEKIINVLRSIGMSKNEVIVYLDLISFKTSSALNISTRTRLHRANTYDALKKLIEKGFVIEVLHDNKRLFRPLELEKIRFYIRQREKEIEEIIPLMKSIVTQEPYKTEEILLSKGIFSLRNALVASLSYTKTIEIYGAPDNFIDLIGEGFFNDFNKQRIKNKIFLRLIFNRKPEKIDELNSIPFTEVRFSRLSCDSLTLIAIFDGEILMTVPVNQISNIIIKNNYISESYREYFNFLWRNSRR